MRFDKFLSSLTPSISVSNTTMNMFFCVSLGNSIYYVIYPKVRDFRLLVNGVDPKGLPIEESHERYDVTSTHVISLAWSCFFMAFALVFHSAMSFIVNITSLTIAILSILSIIIINNRREKTMFSAFGKRLS